MTPKERATALWESWLADGVDDDQRMRADVASTIRAAEDEAWNAALLAAARKVNETDGDPDLIVKSLLRRSPSSGRAQ